MRSRGTHAPGSSSPCHEGPPSAQPVVYRSGGELDRDRAGGARRNQFVRVATSSYALTTTTVVVGAAGSGGCLLIDPAVTVTDLAALAASGPVPLRRPGPAGPWPGQLGAPGVRARHPPLPGRAAGPARGADRLDRPAGEVRLDPAGGAGELTVLAAEHAHPRPGVAAGAAVPGRLSARPPGSSSCWRTSRMYSSAWRLSRFQPLACSRARWGSALASILSLASATSVAQ